MISRQAFRLGLLLTAALIFALPMAASAQDDDPSNPDYLLTVLEDGDTVEGSFADTVTAQLYGFDGAAGDVVTITMAQSENSELDPYIVVLGPAGQLIAKDDDSGELSLSAEVSELELDADGVYFIIASSFNYINGIIGTEPLEEAQDYTLSIQGINDNPDVDEQYFTSRLTLGESFEGYSNVDEPVYYFTFVTEAAASIDVSVTSEDFDTLVMVFAPGGDRIAVNDDDERNAGTDSAVRGIELAEPGKYLIFATDVAFPNAGDDDATLKYEGGDFNINLTSAN